MGDVKINVLVFSGDKKNKKKTPTSLNQTQLELPSKRVTFDVQSSIDIVCSNLDEKYINDEVIVTGLSEHRAQLCMVHVQKQCEYPKATEIYPRQTEPT